MWFRCAADQGLPRAMHILGVVALYAGDSELAIEWFRKAAAANWQYSFYPLGRLLEESGDLDGAYEAYDRGARLDCADSRGGLCQLIVNHSIESHYAIALHLTKADAEKGCRSAQARLALIYQDGLGVELDSHAAFSWWLKSAEQGHPVAQLVVGYAYHNGEYLERDHAAAVRFLMASAAQGSDLAKNYLRNISEELTTAERQKLQELDATRH